MHVLAETANENSSFLWHLSIQVRLDLGRREIRSSLLASLTLFPSVSSAVTSHSPIPSIFCTSPTKAFMYPTGFTSSRISFPYCSSSSDLTDDSWYEIVMSGRRTVGCGLFISFFFFSIFFSLSPCQSFFIWSSLDFALFDTNSCFVSSSTVETIWFIATRIYSTYSSFDIIIVLQQLFSQHILSRSKVLTIEFVMLNERKGVWLNLSRVDDVLVWEQKRMRMWRDGGEGGCVREWKVEGGSSDVAISEMAEISFTPRRVI